MKASTARHDVSCTHVIGSSREEADLRYVEHLYRGAKNCLNCTLSHKIIAFFLSYAVV